MAALPDFSVLGPIEAHDRLTWFQVKVQGRRTVAGVGGRSGPPVLFLHGWALGSHAYKRALSRLLARGCRVYAPALPSFGGTADLKTATLESYGRWVADFMAAVGIDEPAVVIGHSFGGGVALKLAELRPQSVSYLVLLNAVGGVTARPPWEWLYGFGREVWPPGAAWEMANAIRSDLIPNLARNPCGLARSARLAQSADLRAEAERLRAQGLPVLVLTSSGDSVIPRRAFETLCDAIGAEGHVVTGGHSWLLANPDSFATAMAPVIDTMVARHRTTEAATQTGEVLRLLDEISFPRRLAHDLVRGAPPLWLLSESPAVLAADLALCHPKLKPHEVRAVARPLEDCGATRLTVVTGDRRGLLADSAAVLASSGLSITHASAATWAARNLALHSFVVGGRPPLDPEAWRELGRKLQVMTATRLLPALRTSTPLRVTAHGDGGQLLVTITVADEVGALSNLCHAFSDHNINIESLHARSAAGRAVDTFLVSGDIDATGISRIFTKRGWEATRRSAHSRPASSPPGSRRTSSSARLLLVK